MNSTGSGCHNLRSRGSSGVSWSASENQSVLQEQMSLNSNDAHYTQQPAYYPEVPRRYDSTSSSIISAPHDSQQSSSSGYAVLPTLFQSPKGASSKKLKTMSEEQRSRCIQMNSCFVCNMAFVTKKVGSLDDGVKRFQNLCSMLQVPTYEEFLPETNPMCTKCCEGIEEFFKLQRQIQCLINMLGELRKMLGKRLVDTHNVTATCRKNYNIKSKIYEIWSHRVKTSPTVTDLEDNFACIITSLNSGNTFQPPHEQPEAETAYSLLDISNSVSSKADSLANSVAGNCNDDSQDCPSPAASVGFENDDGGDSDYGVEAEDDMVYKKNLNDNDDETPSAKPVEEDNSQWRGGSQSTAPSTNTNFGTFNVIPTEAHRSNMDGGTKSDDFKSSAQQSTKNEAGGADGRKQRPIVVTKRRTHPCKFCGHLFPSNFALEMHERTHTGEKPFKCSILLCDRGFNNKAAMLKHEETHNKSRYQGEPEFECDICGKKYHLKLSLYTHKRDHMGIKRLHPKNRKRKPRAPGSRKNEKSYRKKAGDDGEKKFACSVCAKPFFYSSEAADHASKHSPKYLYKMFFKHQCQACPPEALGFPSKKAIIAHYASAHKDLESPVDQCLYICQVCLEVDGERPVFKSHRGLWNHNKRYHSGGVPKTWKPWPRKKKLDNDDEGDDTDGEQKRLRRKRSSKLSSDRPKRTSSKVSASTKPKVAPERVSCLNCEKTFRSRYDMELHNRIHTGEKPYKCFKCEKAFKLKATLEYHMLTHDPSRFEGEPLHVCDFCGKGFYVWGTLYHHRRRTHLGLQEKYKRPHLKEQMKRPCECKVCGRKFHSVYALYSHKIRHGEKKYRCSVCDKPHFTSTGALEHANRHGPNRRYRIYFRHQCSGCPPEALGFPSKLAIREHWAIAHMDQKIPEKYKKPPKPKGKQKRPGPGVYECAQCPEIDGKKPTFRWQTSLNKHKKAYHSGKPKVWKSKQIGTGQKNSHDSESEDSTSCSGSSSDSDEFNSETKEAQSSKKNKVSQTVRRSVRQTRSDVKNLSQLLNDSESEAEEDDDKTTEKQKKTVRNKTTKLAGPSRATISAPKLSKVTAPIARRSSTKLTGSYINQILGGKQLRLILERIDQEIPASITTPMPTSSKSCRQKAKPKSARSSSQRSEYSNPVNHYKTSPLKIARVMSTANFETTQYVVEDEMPGLECNPVDPLSEVKLDVHVDDDDDDGLEVPSYSQGIAITTTSFSQRQNNFPVIIHNPLSKNKSAAPIVIPPSRKTNVGSHESCETIDSPSKTGNSQSDDDDDESETVLGI